MNISFIGCRNTTKEIISRLLENKIENQQPHNIR